MIKKFKIIKNFDKFDKDSLFQFKSYLLTWSNGWKLNVKPFEMDIEKHIFENRVVNIWNSLPSKVVSSTPRSIYSRLVSINIFCFSFLITYSRSFQQIPIRSGRNFSVLHSIYVCSLFLIIES